MTFLPFSSNKQGNSSVISVDSLYFHVTQIVEQSKKKLPFCFSDVPGEILIHLPSHS